jgi:protoporphyrinogen oxidase
MFSPDPHRGSVADRAPVVVLGAGLTGLSAAFHLGRAGVPHRLFERHDHVGGHAVTIEEDGYRFDRTGHLLHLRDPEVRALAHEWLGGDYLEVERRSVIWSHGRYTRFPFQANTFGLPPDVAYECLMGFIEAHGAKDDRPPPRTFEEFCLQRFGAGFSRHFMVPYNTRLWGVPPSEITADWCARFVPVPRLEDVIAGAVGLHDRELGYNTRFVYPRLGIGQLPEGLARAARAQGTAIELGQAPASIDWQSRLVRLASGEAVPYGALISTIPLPALIGLLDGAPAEVAAAGRRLRHTHLYYLDVALDAPAGRPYHWVYVPEAKYPFYRVGCYSHFSAAMAPPGKAGLYVELADRAEPDLPALLPRVVEGLVEMGIAASDRAIRFARARRIDHAYVVFDHAYYDALATIRPFLDAARVVSTGRYGGWNYSSMEDAIVFGREAAASAGGALRGGPVA